MASVEAPAARESPPGWYHPTDFAGMDYNFAVPLDCVRPSHLMGTSPLMELLVAAAMAISGLVTVLLIPYAGTGSISWMVALHPLVISSLVCLGTSMLYLIRRQQCVTLQLGPPPLEEAGGPIRQHYAFLCDAFLRAHVVENTEHILAQIGLLVSVLLTAITLDGYGSADWRIRVVPAFVGDLAGIVLASLRSKVRKRSVWRAYDWLLLFTLLVAMKLDNYLNWGWKAIFSCAWVWLSCNLLMGVAMVIILISLRAGNRQQIKHLLHPFGIALLLLSSVPLFVAGSQLLNYFEDANGNSELYSVDRLQSTFNALVVYFCHVLVASVIRFVGMWQRNLQRARLVREGRVWTRVANTPPLDVNLAQTMQASIDAMTDETLATMVSDMTASQSKPSNVKRVGLHLYSISAEAGPPETPCTPACTPLHESPEPDPDNEPASVPTRPPAEDADQSSSLYIAVTQDIVHPLFQHPSEPNVVVDIATTDPLSATTPSHSPTPPSVMPTSPTTSVTADDDDKLCIICFERPGMSILLDCGHGGFCRRCANRMYVSTSNECPSCRSKIRTIIDVSVDADVGTVVPVL